MALGVPPVLIDFNGTMPPEATLIRSTPRIDDSGAVAGPNVPRFQTCAVGSAGIQWALLPETERVLDVREIGGVTYTLVDLDCGIALTTDTPGLDTPIYTLPDPAIDAKFGCSGSEWGRPRYGEIYPDGTIILASSSAGADLRLVVLRSTVSTFADPDGFALVLTSPYVPPEGFTVTTVGIGRATTLPNLGITVSALAEYSAGGMASTAFPGDGRSLGFASSDGGLTWSRVIDTDDPVLGRQFFTGAKHLHRLQAFEWYDDQSAQWKIGVIGVLGDGPGASGEILAYAPSGVYPPEGQNSLLDMRRTKVDSAQMLTEMFPLNLSLAPGQPLTFLQGPDGENAGVVRVSIEGDVQTDTHVVRPTAPILLVGRRRIFQRYPNIFEMTRLGNGCVAIPTFENSGSEINPNGIWLSDPTGTYWTTANLQDGDGFKTAHPFGNNYLWALLNIGVIPTATAHSSLWDIEPPVVRQSLAIGCGARDLQSLGLPSDPETSVTDVTGTVTPPSGAPATTPVYRIQSQTMIKNQVFWSKAASIANVEPGQFVTVEYWVKSAALDMGVQHYRHDLTLLLPSGASQTSWSMWVEPTINDWLRVMLVELVDESGPVDVTTSANMVDDASAALPLDYYVTEPQLYVTSQPTIQRFEPGLEGADQLTVALPALASSWSVAVSGTEARSWAMSLVDANGAAAVVQPRAYQQPLLSPDLNLREGIDVALELSTIFAGTETLGGRSHSHDVFYPTQNVVVLTMDASINRLTMWVSRGLGDLDEIKVDGVTLSPTELRFGTPDWSIGYEGLVHSVKVWPDVAITRQDVELERYGGRFIGFPPPPVICHADIDNDGSTTVFDFAILALNFGTPGGPGEGDLNGDGVIDVFDFAILATEFGCIASP